MKRHAEPIGSEALRVRIRVGGRLDQGWSAWFEGLTVVPLEDAETSLSGSVADQASLHGLLLRIRDLGLPLLGLDVTQHDVAASDSPDGGSGPERGDR